MNYHKSTSLLLLLISGLFILSNLTIPTMVRADETPAAEANAGGTSGGTSSSDLKILGAMMGSEASKTTLINLLNEQCQTYFKMEMAASLKSAPQNEASNKLIESNAKKLCDCSSPKTLPLIEAALKKPEAEQGPYFDAEAMKLGFECMK